MANNSDKIDNSELKLLIKKRGSCKAQLTQFETFLSRLDGCDGLSELLKTELGIRMKKIELLQSDFDKLQCEIELLSDNVDEAYADRDQFESKLFRLLSVAHGLLAAAARYPAAGAPGGDGTSDAAEECRGGGFVRLPKIDLPHFDGDYQHWLSFRVLSTALVKVADKHGSLHTARLLLDNGSTSNFVTESLCEKLDLKRYNASSTVSVKAVHIELVSSLTKEAYLAALNRFMARRGRPQTIYSDHGSNFIGGFNELSDLFRSSLSDIPTILSHDEIDFKFIPPYSPHFGGIWEAAVKSVKHHLRRVLALAHLTYEEMITCLNQIEAILNSRPLTPLSSDPSDLSFLSPSHFLIGRPLTSVPYPQVSDSNVHRLDRFQRIEFLRQHFWKRYCAEYVTLLQQKTKWLTSTGHLQVGSLVLVKDKTQPPLMWLMGRIVQLHPGKDGVSRVADIETKRGIIQRAYNNICPLPLDC
ncbi:uncharacterized protein LOC119693424 isoform X2 [Plutella xylostella]|uniref:uncharacterized protein LOC119693424 isoform X2 n=1 Tax=Plutella xylostella TaxID=51655 RepID=UPI0020329C00|nr:uncharacterized protein LOC119693424 isoform X2 [Plutella xylostella]